MRRGFVWIYSLYTSVLIYIRTSEFTLGSNLSIWLLCANVGALRLIAHIHKPRQGKLFFGRVRDFDRTQGSTDGRDFNPRVWRSPVGDLGTDFFNYTWSDRLCRDIDFWQRRIDRYQSLRDGALSTYHIDGVIDEFAAKVRTERSKEATEVASKWWTED